MGSANDSTRRRVALVAVSVAGLLILAWLFLWWWSRPPQMGADEEVAKAVDALFTAVTARDEKRLADCEQRLRTFQETGKLPLKASAYLDNIIGKARAGGWESAAQTLYDFVRAQRREGAHEHPRNEKSRSDSGPE